MCVSLGSSAKDFAARFLRSFVLKRGFDAETETIRSFEVYISREGCIPTGYGKSVLSNPTLPSCSIVNWEGVLAGQ